MKVKEETKEPLSNGFLVVGFPGIGNVGPIAANFLVEHLKMTHVASVYDPRLPPTTVVRKGRALSPIRIYSSAEACGLDGKCDRLVVLLSDIPIDLALIGELADASLQWAKKKGVRQVAVLEGVPPEKLPDGVKDSSVHGIQSLRSRLVPKSFKVRAVQEGVITTPGAAFLLAADQLDMDGFALFTPARPDEPDAKAAGNLLLRVDPMLPKINLGSKEFVKQVQAIDSAMKQNKDAHLRDLKALKNAYDFMYA